MPSRASSGAGQGDGGGFAGWLSGAALPYVRRHEELTPFRKKEVRVMDEVKQAPAVEQDGGFSSLLSRARYLRRGLLGVEPR